jgi:acyl carrier protein
MTDEDIRAVVVEVLASVAPEGDFDRLKPDLPLRDQLDIDSYDFLNVIVQLHERLGVDIPETDYRHLSSLDGVVAYLARRMSR